MHAPEHLGLEAEHPFCFQSHAECFQFGARGTGSASSPSSDFSSWKHSEVRFSAQCMDKNSKGDAR